MKPVASRSALGASNRVFNSADADSERNGRLADMYISYKTRIMASLVIGCTACGGTPATGQTPVTAQPISVAPPPAAPTVNMSTDDPFRTLETASPERAAWEEAQTASTLEALHHRRGFEDVLRRVRAYRDAPQPPRQLDIRGQAVFSLEQQTTANTTAIVRRKGAEAKILFQTAAGNEKSREHIDFMSVSRSGRFVAFGVSTAGVEETTVRVLEVSSGRDLGDRVRDVRNSSLEWLPDDTGFIYMRGRGRTSLPVKDQIRDLSAAVHVLGAPFEKDTEVVGSRAGGERIHQEFEYCYPSVSADGRYVVISVRHGINPDLRIYVKSRAAVLDGSTPWTQIYAETDHVKTVALGKQRLVAVRALDEQTNVIEERDLSKLERRNVIYSTSKPLESAVVAGATTYVVEIEMGIKRLQMLRGEAPPVPVGLPVGRSIWSDGVRFDPISERVVLDLRSWAEPATWWSVRKGGGGVDPIAEVSVSGQRSEDFDVRSIEAVARDGEHIPLTVISRRDVPTTKHVWVTAYGSYGLAFGPTFTVARRTFLELGGTYVFAHVRGGGEKGRAWHDAGRGANKMRTIDDTIDCLKYLRASGFGAGGGIVTYGASAGGMPVGGLLVRHPELVDGVVLDSAIVNVSRLEEGSAIGVLHAQEIGTSKTPEGAQRLHDLDVYANVRDGVKYPPTLVFAGVNDARVPHWQSDKLVSRLLQAGATSSLRLTGGGHIAGNTREEEAHTDAELVVFALSNTGHPDFK